MGCCKRLIAAVLAACIVSVAALPATAADASVAQDLKELPKDKFGQSREHLTRIANAVRDAKGVQRARLTRQLVAVLTSNATPDAKRFVCRQLSIVGTAKEVPALAPLLLDKELSDIARYALERTPD